MKHRLKTYPPYFDQLLNGEKLFDYRPNDRDFKVGDEVVFQEYDPRLADYTGRHFVRRINYVFDGGQLNIPEGYCIIQIDYEKLSEYFEISERAAKVETILNSYYMHIMQSACVEEGGVTQLLEDIACYIYEKGFNRERIDQRARESLFCLAADRNMDVDTLRKHS